MKAYSADLRDRVARACAQPSRTTAQVAAQFSVSTPFIDKLLHRQRRAGSVAAKAPSGGPAPRLDNAAQAAVLAWVEAQPDTTLAEVRQHLVARGGPMLSVSVLCRVL